VQNFAQRPVCYPARMSEETMADNTTEETPEAEEAEATAATTAALLTADQVAERLGITTRRLRDWRKEGKLAEVGRFKRGTARVPLFDPADVARLQRATEGEETPASAVATVADPALFGAAVAHQVRLLLAERAEAEATAVAPLVALVREQQETIDELRHRAEVAEAARDRRTAAQAAPNAPGATAALTPDNPSAAPSAGLWARVRRVFGGG